MQYFIYCRKSREDEGHQILSIPAQIRELTELARFKDLKVAEVLQESKSAHSPGREIFNQLMGKAEKGEIDGLIVWKLDRLARNPLDGGKIIWLLDIGKLKEIITPGRTFKNNSDDKFLMQIEFGMAKKYSDDLSDNVKRGLREKVLRGEYPRKAPLGYINDRNTRNIVLDPAKWRYAREIFELYATGDYSLKELAKMFYEKGFRTLSGKKVVKAVIYRIITSQTYYGYFDFNIDGKYYLQKGTYQPIISKDLFDKCQEVLNSFHKKHRKGHDFPLRGFFHCGICGCLITAELQKGHNYYRCTKSKGNCGQPYTRSEDLEKEVSKILAKLELDEKFLELSLRAGEEKEKQKEQTALISQENLRGQYKILEDRKSKLLDKFLDGSVPEELYKEKLKEITGEQADIEQSLEKIKEGIRDTFELKKKVLKVSSLSQKLFLTRNPEVQKKILTLIPSNLILRNRKIADFRLNEPFSWFYNNIENGEIAKLRRRWDSN